MNEIGELFSVTRKTSGISLEEVSKDLNIKKEMLENIEDGRVGAFKDIFELKEDISSYAKYLGLDVSKVIDEFNEYMFEYTSKILIKEIEKTIELQIKEDHEEKIASPYTKASKKYNNKVYIIVYVVILLLVLVITIWSIKQVTIGQNVTNEISYRK